MKFINIVQVNLKEKGYIIIVLNFREPQRGNSWNPLALPNNYYRAGNQDKAIELLRRCFKYFV